MEEPGAEAGPDSGGPACPPELAKPASRGEAGGEVDATGAEEPGAEADPGSGSPACPPELAMPASRGEAGGEVDASGAEVGGGGG